MSITFPIFSKRVDDFFIAFMNVFPLFSVFEIIFLLVLVYATSIHIKKILQQDIHSVLCPSFVVLFSRKLFFTQINLLLQHFSTISSVLFWKIVWIHFTWFAISIRDHAFWLVIKIYLLIYLLNCYSSPGPLQESLIS